MWRCTLATIMLSIAVAGSTRAEPLVVIVHPERTTKIGLPEIAQIYLKQRRFWRDGALILPVNREAKSGPRESFSQAVFGAESRSLIAYWNREYFRGVLPPITLASDIAVRRFVATEPRAIGYIPADLVDDSVRVAFRIE